MGLGEAVLDFLASRPAGALIGFGLSAAEQKEVDKFREGQQAIGKDAEARRAEAFEGAPPPSGVRVRPGLNAETTALIQRRIDAGTAPEAWLGQFTEHVSRTRRGRAGEGGGLIGATERIARQGLAETEAFFGPEAAAKRFTSFADPIRSGLAGISDEARTGIAGLQAGFAGLEEEGRVGAAELVSGQQARERELMGMLEGAGLQERRDIGAAFAAQGANEQQRLGMLGLAGTSAATSARMGTLRGRTSAFGRLEERLRTERLGLSERLSGETLQAQAGALEFGLGLRREGLGVEASGLEFMTDLERRRVGAEADLGLFGLQHEQDAFGNLQRERERLGLMPAEARIRGYESFRGLHVGDQIVNQPPFVGDAAELQRLSMLQG